MKKSIFLFLFILFVCVTGFALAGKVATFSGHIMPEQIQVDDEQIYIVEGPSISIYSLKDFKLIRKFGRKGEGPREFMGEIRINIDADYILVNSLNRVTFFEKRAAPAAHILQNNNKGDAGYIKEFNHVNGRQFEPLGKDRFIGHLVLMENNGRRFHTVNIYDSSFKRVKKIWQEESMAFSPKQQGWYLFFKPFCRSLVLNHRVYIVGHEGFTIDVLDLKGNILSSIKKEYEKVKFTEHHKQKILELYRTRPSTRHEYDAWKRLLNFPDYFPAIRNIFTDGKRLYVRTYRERGENSEFVIFDDKGILLKKVYLPIAPSTAKFAFPYMRDSSPFAFQNGKLYQLVGNEEQDEEKAEWELHVIEVE